MIVKKTVTKVTNIPMGTMLEIFFPQCKLQIFTGYAHDSSTQTLCHSNSQVNAQYHINNGIISKQRHNQNDEENHKSSKIRPHN